MGARISGVRKTGGILFHFVLLLTGAGTEKTERARTRPCGVRASMHQSLACRRYGDASRAGYSRRRFVRILVGHEQAPG